MLNPSADLPAPCAKKKRSADRLVFRHPTDRRHTRCFGCLLRLESGGENLHRDRPEGSLVRGQIHTDRQTVRAASTEIVSRCRNRNSRSDGTPKDWEQGFTHGGREQGYLERDDFERILAREPRKNVISPKNPRDF
ncbi:MAG: hypothetical protein R3F11_32230 [Verrucomicrobiales bacterium]